MPVPRLPPSSACHLRRWTEWSIAALWFWGAAIQPEAEGSSRLGRFQKGNGMTAFLIIVGLFVGAVQFIFAAALGQKLQTPDRSASRIALVIATCAYLIQAALFLAAGAQFARLS